MTTDPTVPDPRYRIGRARIVVSFFVVSLTALLVTAGAHPTESTLASWHDRAFGTATFKTLANWLPPGYVRGAAGYGTVSRALTQPSQLQARASSRVYPEQGRVTSSGTLNNSGILGFLSVAVTSTTCARHFSDATCSSWTAPAPVSDVAVTGTSVKVNGGPLGTYDLLETTTAFSVSVSCAAGSLRYGAPAGAVRVRNNPVVVGSWTGPFSVPSTPGGVTTLSGGNRTGTLRWTVTQTPTSIVSEITHTLHDTTTGFDFEYAMVVARAECALSGTPSPLDYTPAATSAVPLSAARTECPESVDAESARPDRAPGEKGLGPSDSDEIDLATSDSDSRELLPNTLDGCGTETTFIGPVAADTPAATPNRTDPDTGIDDNSAPGSTEDEATAGEATAGAAPRAEATTPAEPEIPLGPEQVRIGERFTVRTEDGSAIGTAVFDLVALEGNCRSASAAVASIRMTVTTTGTTLVPVHPGQFTELNPAGTFPVSGASDPPCSTDHPPSSPLVADDAGSIHVALEVTRGATQISWRPSGTTGWILDLPPMPAAVTERAAVPDSAGVPAGTNNTGTNNAGTNSTGDAAGPNGQGPQDAGTASEPRPDNASPTGE